jgi:hypothetical protein
MGHFNSNRFFQLAILSTCLFCQKKENIFSKKGCKFGDDEDLISYARKDEFLIVIKNKTDKTREGTQTQKDGQKQKYLVPISKSGVISTASDRLFLLLAILSDKKNKIFSEIK